MDESALLLFNASGNDVDFVLPPADHGASWTVAIGTGETVDIGTALDAEQWISRPAHSLLVLTRPPMEDIEEPADGNHEQTTRA